MDPLLAALKSGDKESVLAWSTGEQWLTVEHFLDAHDGEYSSVVIWSGNVASNNRKRGITAYQASA